jgi:hypothetical protein
MAQESIIRAFRSELIMVEPPRSDDLSDDYVSGASKKPVRS